MQVANLELCKALYVLSGWKDTDYTYYANAGEYTGMMLHRSECFDKPDNLPAYDLGYLLSRLPRSIPAPALLKHDQQWLTVASSKDGWYARYGMSTTKSYAPTPEDAAVLLAIKLLDLDILHKD